MFGAIQVLHNAMCGGGIHISADQRYEDARLTLLALRAVGGGDFQKKVA